MKTEIRKINPSIAKEMLKRNANNRAYKDKHSKRLANEMTAGNWLFDGQPIRFTDGGILVDGQHRLNAIIKSNTEQDFLILTGVTRESFKVMDTGMNRNASDVFHIEGITNATNASATTRFIINHHRGQNNHVGGGSEKVSNTDILNYYKQNENRISYFVSKSSNLYKLFNKVLPCATLAGLMYIFAEKDAVLSEVFWGKVCSGLALERGCPTLTLRNKLIADKISKSSLPAGEKKALIVKAWNCYRLGKKIHILRYNKETEKFPQVI